MKRRLSACAGTRAARAPRDFAGRPCQDASRRDACRGGARELLDLDALEGLKPFLDVLSHELLGFPGAAREDGLGDAAVAGVRAVDTLGVVERGEKEAVRRHAQPFDEHGDVAVAGPFDDEAMPFVVEPREAFMVARVLDGVEIFLHPRKPALELGDIGRGEVAGREPFERHPRAIDLPDFVTRELLDGCAAKLLDRDQAFR